jgi:hypothetical protein
MTVWPRTNNNFLDWIGHVFRGNRNEESLCWRGPAAVYCMGLEWSGYQLEFSTKAGEHLDSWQAVVRSQFDTLSWPDVLWNPIICPDLDPP